MMSSLLPLLAIFQLDGTLWRYWNDFEIMHPCSRMDNGTVVDKNNTVRECYPEINAVFEKLNNSGIKIAIHDECRELNDTAYLITLFDWYKYVSYVELFKIAEDEARERFEKIKNESGIPYNKMIFFNDDMKLIFEDDFPIIDIYKDIGFHSVWVDHRIGMTEKLLNDGFKEYELKQRGNSTTS